MPTKTSSNNNNSTGNSKKRIAVVGSGFGGLASAIRLQSAGFQVKIFEKRDLPGGRAYVFKEKGFTFDAGPTVITEPKCLEELFNLSGRKIEDYVKLVSISPFYRLVFDDGYRFDYTNDDKELFRQIHEKCPKDVEGYKTFLKYSQKVYDAGYTKLAAVPFLKIWDMVKVAPQLIKLSAYRSVYSMISKFISDEHLRQAFSFHSLLVGGNPFSTSSIYTLIHYLERSGGVYFPMGGTHALVRALVKLFEDLGGQIVYQAEVNQILTENKSVTGLRMVNGDVWPCDAVVSNGDVFLTYKNLLSETNAVHWRRQFLSHSKYSMSLFLIYFGTKKKYDNITQHTVLFGPRYKELLEEIFNKGTLPDDFSLYLHAPTRTDASLAPEGHESFYVLAPVGNLGKLKINWETEAPIYSEKILKYLEEKYLPNLRENIVVKKIFTPNDFEQQLNSHLGAAFSLEPLLTQSAYFRQHNKDKNVKGLYFAGAGTHPGAGVPGVINSGKATAGLIIEDMKN